MKNKSKNNTNRRQKVLAFIALAGLFASGLMVGLAFTKTKYVEKDVAPVTSVSQDETLPEKTCSAVERLLSQRLYKEEDLNERDCSGFLANADVYKQMIENGCPENQDKYTVSLQRNLDLARAVCYADELVQAGIVIEETNADETCLKIEEEMLRKICRDCGGTSWHLDNAKVYSILAERGCPENSQKYVDLAKQEIAIARALEDDKFSEGETLEVVETYKRINMQAAAEEVFEKAKQLTNPAIDFILQVEKIINE